jgi:hypothetical protein
LRCFIFWIGLRCRFYKPRRVAAQNAATLLGVLQQLPSQKATRKNLKALLCNAFKFFLGLGFSTKRFKS